MYDMWIALNMKKLCTSDYIIVCMRKFIFSTSKIGFISLFKPSMINIVLFSIIFLRLRF